MHLCLGNWNAVHWNAFTHTLLIRIATEEARNLSSYLITKNAEKSLVKMATKTTEDRIIKCDNLTIISANDKTNECKIQKYLIQNWQALSQEMDNSTILFMGGAHGSDLGKFGERENIQTLKNQVSNNHLSNYSKLLNDRTLHNNCTCWKIILQQGQNDPNNDSALQMQVSKIKLILFPAWQEKNNKGLWIRRLVQ